MPGPEPAITDAFWFRMSEGMVSGARDRWDQAAQRLQTLVVWLWAILAAGAGIGAGLAGHPLGRVGLALAILASAVLVAAYWASVWAQEPATLRFDPRAPAQISRAYDKAVASARRRVTTTLAFSLVGAALVVSALSFAAMRPAAGGSPTLAAATVAAPCSLVAVTAHVAPSARATLWVQSLPDRRDSLSVQADDAGKLQAYLPVDRSAGPREIVLDLPQAGGEHVRVVRPLVRRGP